MLEASLRTYADFLPGHPERPKVMDRLHAFCYFLEGLLPRAADPRCAAALRDGIGLCARHLRDIAPEFERSDVYAQLLRIRLYADWLGVVPLDCSAAEFEAAQLAAFQADGFRSARHPGEWGILVRTQERRALCPSSIRSRRPSPARRWNCGRPAAPGAPQPHRHLLI